jgi:GGDEF domain-containing protein
VAKGWLLSLLEELPLDQAAGVLAADLARDGPRICDAVLRALADDVDLRRIEPGGALEQVVARAGVLAAAQGPGAASHAVDTLHGVIWSAMRDELRYPDPEQVSELSERLALVTGLVRAAALRRAGSGNLGAGEAATAGSASEGVAPEAVPPGSSGPRGVAPSESVSPGSVGPLGSAPPGASGSAPRAGGAAAEAGGAAAEAPHAPRQAPGPASATALAQPEALWKGAVEDEIARAERVGSPLSLLLVDLEDANRVASVEQTGAATTFGHFAQAVRSAVRRQDILACETESRAWVIARDTGRAGAGALASRIASAVQAAPPWRGAPLRLTAGLAVLGEDGGDTVSLIEAAEEAMFAAAASGNQIGGPANGDLSGPPDRGPRLAS